MKALERRWKLALIIVLAKQIKLVSAAVTDGGGLIVYDYWLVTTNPSVPGQL